MLLARAVRRTWRKQLITMLAYAHKDHELSSPERARLLSSAGIFRVTVRGGGRLRAGAKTTLWRQNNLRPFLMKDDLSTIQSLKEVV